MAKQREDRFNVDPNDVATWDILPVSRADLTEPIKGGDSVANEAIILRNQLLKTYADAGLPADLVPTQEQLTANIRRRGNRLRANHGEHDQSSHGGGSSEKIEKPKPPTVKALKVGGSYHIRDLTNKVIGTVRVLGEDSVTIFSPEDGSEIKRTTIAKVMSGSSAKGHTLHRHPAYKNSATGEVEIQPDG